MPVHFKIRVTKENIAKSMYCASDEDDLTSVGQECAIALALKDLFPDVYVTGHHIHPFGFEIETEEIGYKIELPENVREFISKFDDWSFTPELRIGLQEFDFTMAISDEVLSRINIEEIIHKSVVKSYALVEFNQG